MMLVIIDGQSGRMGALIAERAKAAKLPCKVLAVGTNAIATATMMKAGANQGATGENPVMVACRTADVIVGPIGILSADALSGEVTPAMAVAIGQSAAKKLLLPVNRHCGHTMVGRPGSDSVTTGGRGGGATATPVCGRTHYHVMSLTKPIL